MKKSASLEYHFNSKWDNRKMYRCNKFLWHKIGPSKNNAIPEADLFRGAAEKIALGQEMVSDDDAISPGEAVDSVCL